MLAIGHAASYRDRLLARPPHFHTGKISPSQLLTPSFMAAVGDGCDFLILLRQCLAAQKVIRVESRFYRRAVFISVCLFNRSHFAATYHIALTTAQSKYDMMLFLR